VTRLSSILSSFVAREAAARLECHTSVMEVTDKRNR